MDASYKLAKLVRHESATHRALRDSRQTDVGKAGRCGIVGRRWNLRPVGISFIFQLQGMIGEEGNPAET